MSNLTTVSFIIVIALLVLMGINPWARPSGITDLTYQLTSQAEIRLDETFQQSDVNFAIWPPEEPPFEVKPLTRLALVAGVRNDASDNASHVFAVEMQHISGPTNATSWIAANGNSKQVAFGSISKFSFLIEVPKEAEEGIYVFRVIACTITTGEAACSEPIEGETQLWESTTKSFILGITRNENQGMPYGFEMIALTLLIVVALLVFDAHRKKKKSIL